ncbi:hypothetical protein N5D48_03770 [Pseudomonas sp. GD03858]|uniref:hypothetical protein n=1 Tax=unclassified Pseudomonas TaxID=196821 RepID=UPI002446B4B1|nr:MULTISPECIES: hypothetical protein [unclassified Pseudomonas]MDH0645884.1 hypothetical protein [Pseudomonas sp. GD03867]MDH0661508.1 hypothetical protein [Pseudomonas sp. GD03858]
MPKGFKAVSCAVIAALESGSYLHVSRGDIEVKNLLALGAVSADEVIDIVRVCNGSHYSSPHHAVPAIEVHVLKRHGWYIKFYFIEPRTWFLSVHQ